MFRNRGNILGSTTQTINPPIIINENNEITNINNTVLFSVVTGNLKEVTKLVNNNNINNIIDKTNNYTSLHYAVKLPNKNIVEYLISCGANPKIKQNEGKDAIDLSIESNKRYLIDHLLTKNDLELDNIYSKFDDISHNKKILESENTELKQANQYLNIANDQYVKKIDELKKFNQDLHITNNTAIKKIDDLNENNVKLKRKADDSEKAFTELWMKHRKK